MNWETLLSYPAELICLQPSLLSSLHFSLILDNLTGLGKVKDKLLKQLLPSKLGTPSLPKRGVSAGNIVTLPPTLRCQSESQSL